MAVGWSGVRGAREVAGESDELQGNGKSTESKTGFLYGCGRWLAIILCFIKGKQPLSKRRPCASEEPAD